MTTTISDLIKICAQYCIVHERNVPSTGANVEATAKWMAETICHAEDHNGAALAQMVINADRAVNEETV